MKFRYEMDLSKLNITDAEKKKIDEVGQKGIFETFITNLFQTKYPDGVKGMTVRCLAKFFDKLDNTQEQGELSLDDKDVELLKEVLIADIALNPHQVRYYSHLQKELERVLNEAKG